MIDTAIWVALTVAAPVGARTLRTRLQSRTASWNEELSFWTRAAYGVVPLYGAWVTGAVSGTDGGMLGVGLTRWLSGGALCAALLLAIAFTLRLPAVRHRVQAWVHPTRSWLVLLDEPRWAFYRGAGAVALGGVAPAQFLGLALGGLEWLARNGRPSRSLSTEALSELVRLGMSAVLFALTRNLWLILGTQAVLAALLLRSWSDSATAA